MANLLRPPARPASTTVLVVGLGRFGSACATSLVAAGSEVLAIDNDPVLVQRMADQLTHVMVADSTDEEALRQLGVESIEKAIVGIGSDIEASIMTVLALAQLGVEEIWAKAITKQHGLILERIGAHHVLYPERAMGERVAHAVSGSMIDYFEFEDGFSIARTSAPKMSWGRPLSESVIRSKFNVTVVGVKRRSADFTYAQPETVVLEGDELIVSGQTRLVEQFCQLP